MHMDVAALIFWILTAAGGFFMLGTWVSKGGHRQPGNGRFPPALIFGHFGLAAIGLIVWIIFVAAGTQALAWIAFVILLPVALMGFAMLVRWLPTYRARAGAPATASAAAGQAPAEQHFPVAVVGVHGLLAVTTLVLVLLSALGVGT